MPELLGRLLRRRDRGVASGAVKVSAALSMTEAKR